LKKASVLHDNQMTVGSVLLHGNRVNRHVVSDRGMFVERAERYDDSNLPAALCSTGDRQKDISRYPAGPCRKRPLLLPVCFLGHVGRDKKLFTLIWIYLLLWQSRDKRKRASGP